jgi:hypothetical protein
MRWVQRVLLAAVGVLVALVAAEGVLRRWGPVTRGTDVRGITHPHPDGGFGLRPGVTQTVHGCLGDFHSRVIINSHGFRFPEYPKAKSPGTRRIALLGDSEVFGVGVDQAQTLDRCLEAALNRDPAARVEVLNFAIPGVGPLTHVRVLEDEAVQWELDAAILLVTVVNDLGDLLGGISTPPDPMAAAVVPRRRLVDFELYQLAKRKVFPRLPAFLTPRAAWVGDQPGFIKEWFLNDQLEQQLAQLERTLAQMKNLCEEQGITFYLSDIPARSQFDPAIQRMLARILDSSLWSEVQSDWDRPQRRLQELATPLQLTYVPVLPAFRQAAQSRARQLKHPNDGHLSADGTAELAGILAVALGGNP